MGGKANKCTFKRSFSNAIFAKLRLNVLGFGYLPAEWEFRQTHLTDQILADIYPFWAQNCLHTDHN